MIKERPKLFTYKVSKEISEEIEHYELLDYDYDKIATIICDKYPEVPETLGWRLGLARGCSIFGYEVCIQARATLQQIRERS